MHRQFRLPNPLRQSTADISLLLGIRVRVDAKFGYKAFEAALYSEAFTWKSLPDPHDEYVAGLRPVEGEDAKVKSGEGHFVRVKAGGEVAVVA